MHKHASLNEVVLVVDDSPDTVGLLNEALENAGMTVLVALHGSQAMSIASRMLPDLILLDAVMPQMDGFEVCRQLKFDPELRNIPVIFMTGLKDTQSIVAGFAAGSVDYITKPINMQELVARVRVHLTNAKITLSAQAALDIAGQYVFAVNNCGEVLWSTPQVNRLLNKTGQSLEAGGVQTQKVATWLASSPQVGMGIELSQELRVEFIAHSETDQILLRLVDRDQKDEASYLKEVFPITRRESQVLFWIVRGKTNREIGQILGTSPRTINKHLEQLFKKLQVENRTAAAAKAAAIIKRH